MRTLELSLLLLAGKGGLKRSFLSQLFVLVTIVCSRVLVSIHHSLAAKQCCMCAGQADLTSKGGQAVSSLATSSIENRMPGNNGFVMSSPFVVKGLALHSSREGQVTAAPMPWVGHV